MPTLYVCPECGDEYDIPGRCTICQINLSPADAGNVEADELEEDDDDEVEGDEEDMEGFEEDWDELEEAESGEKDSYNDESDY